MKQGRKRQSPPSEPQPEPVKTPRTHRRLSWRDNLMLIATVAGPLIAIIIAVFQFCFGQDARSATAPTPVESSIIEETFYSFGTNDERLAHASDKLKSGSIDDARYAEAFLMHFFDQELDDRTSAVVYYDLGLCEYAMGLSDSAIAKFILSIQAKPFSDAYYALGYVYAAEPDSLPSAVDAFTNALALDPRPEYYLARADAYEQQLRFQDAKEDFEAVLRFDSENAAALAGIKRCELQL